MRGFNMSNITFMIMIALLLWCCTMETCNARQGKHWRNKRGSIAASLSKKKPKNHHHVNVGKGKKKPPTPQPPVAPPPTTPPVPAVPVTPSPDVTVPDSTTVFNVLNFGAKGDGKTDDTKAFQAAWASACKTEASTIMVPSKYVFLVGPISFSGPYCQHNIIFQLEGKIVAPTNPKPWGSGILQWLEFTKLVGITVQGGGVIDGNGAVWWQNTPYVDESISDSLGLGTRMPSIKPTALRFYGSFNATVTGITIQNSQQCHLKFDNCIGVSVYNFTVSSPGDSPNTDGIHLQNTRDVLIRNSNLGCGDDCVSVQTGCTNVYVHDVNCGPGHGISIGGLGKDNTKACVSNITVRNVIMQNTMYGARIKTWQGGSGLVQGIHFSNIQVSEVQSPVMIDQFYCDKKSCKNQTSAVALTGIHFEKIKGTYTVTPVHLACSDSMPCTDVTLTDFELKPVQKMYHMYDPYCWQSYGELYAPTIPPVYCLQGGKPSSTPQGDDDSC